MIFEVVFFFFTISMIFEVVLFFYDFNDFRGCFVLYVFCVGSLLLISYDFFFFFFFFFLYE